MEDSNKQIAPHLLMCRLTMINSTKSLCPCQLRGASQIHPIRGRCDISPRVDIRKVTQGVIFKVVVVNCRWAACESAEWKRWVPS
ncbi:hypothetical protein L484_021582 [Morus notabilis]|uniref:Uncharacterized protein n=1 Tax=Morus notabilis TaxID=981085 RepID=W9RXV9_9ROSA|nr:hypothetical protein L484_021582 [Morus notabilis]